MTTLYIKVVNDDVREYYEQAVKDHNTNVESRGDSGFDLYCPHDVTVKPRYQKKIDFGIQCEMKKDRVPSWAKAPMTLLYDMAKTFYITLSAIFTMESPDILADDRFNGQYNVGYTLMPRSSISKTPLRMSNSIGLIDQGYRGNIMAFVDHINVQTVAAQKKIDQHYIDERIRADAAADGEIVNAVVAAPSHPASMDTRENAFRVNKGQRLFQIVAPNLESFHVELVDILPGTVRGSGGFGSTG